MDDTTKVIRIVIDSSRAVDGSAAATRALKQIEDQTKNTSDILGRLQAGFETVTKLTVFGLGIREVTSRLAEMWTTARDAAVAIQDLSEQLGVSVKFVQASQFAAASNTVSLEQMGTGFTKASKIIGEATQGNKGAIDTLNAMGVKILDASGKLRSTESILSDSAAAILKVEDPAKRVALAMQLFGKTGAELIPMLKDLAMGQDVMATKAAAAGAMIEEGVLKQVAALKAHSEEASLKWNALVLNIGTPIATAAMEAVDKLLSSILANLDRLKLEAAATAAGVPQAKSDVANINDQIAAQEGLLRINRNNFSAKASLEGPNGLYARRDQLLAAQRNATQTLYQSSEDAARNGSLAWERGYTVNPAVGDHNPTSTEDGKAAESLAQKIQKLKDTLVAAADSQDAMTAAARQGDTAFQQQQAHSEALTKAIEAYDGKLTAANPKVQQLAANLEQVILRQKEGAAAQTFVVATTELDKQNTLLAAQIALMNQAPDVQAREIALIKSKQEAEKAGNALTAQDIDNRRQAIEQNERLKLQQEQLKQAQELWTEPLKQALRDIQTAGANAFEQMLQNGEISFKSLAQTFTTTLRKMAAEFLALATIRPVLSVAVSAATGLGVVSPAAAAQLGYPQGIEGTSVAGGGLSGGGGLDSILNGGGGGGGWLGRQFSGVREFMNTPIFGIGGSVTPGFEAASSSPYAFADLSGAYGGLGGAAAPTGAMGGLTWGQGLGALGGFASGAMTLMGGDGSAGNMVSGIGQMIGAGVSLIPGVGQIAGPLIMLGSSILGGALGGGPKIPPMPGLGYGQGTIYFSNPLHPVGSGGMAAGANSVGQAVQGLISASGGTPIAGKLYSGTFASGTNHTWDGKQWVGQNYTQANTLSPTGAVNFIGGTGAGVSVQDAADKLAVQIFRQDVLTGAIKGVTDTLKNIFAQITDSTTKAAQEAITFANAYDALGKAANPVKDSIDKLNQQFSTLSSQATTYGLSLDPINAALAKQTKRTAQDFIDNMLDPLAVQMRALADERESALAGAQYIKDNVTGVYVDMAKVAEYYTNKEAALRDQFYQGSVTSLQNLINRLTYGDLANASPSTSLAGTRASYSATLAQARAGVASAITALPGVAEAYSSTARNYFASSPEYAALIAQIRKDLEEVVGVATGGTASGAGSAQQINQAVQTQLAVTDRQAEVISDLGGQVADLKNMVSSLVAQLRSQATNRM